MSEFFRALEQAERDRLLEERQRDEARRRDDPRRAAPSEPPRRVETPTEPPRRVETPNERDIRALRREVDPFPELTPPPAPAAPPPPRKAEPRRSRPAASKQGRRLITEVSPTGPEAEAYRALRANIESGQQDGQCRSIVVTSASTGEGKSTTAANLAVVSAETGLRVCLIDGDLRRPVLHDVFGISNERGLADALANRESLEDVAQASRFPNLAIVTAGTPAGNPGQLLSTNRLRELLDGASGVFDRIVIDSSPIISVSDSLAMATQCDGLLLVVKAGGVSASVVRRAALQIEQVRGRILGVLLNRVNLRGDGSDYYRYYRAYYSSERR
jgi:capsular exopolysaccharide synthesis family protein